MKTYTTMQKTYTESTLIRITSDRCGKDIPLPSPERGFIDSTVCFEVGKPLGKDKTAVTGWCVEDVCAGCAEVLREILVENGFKVTELSRQEIYD